MSRLFITHFLFTNGEIMKYIYLLILTALLIGASTDSKAIDYDMTFCYSCTETDKVNRAKSKLGYSDEKHVIVINKATRQPTTYRVFKVVEPGLYQIFARRISTETNIKDLIDDLYLRVDLLKNLAYSPIRFDDLHFTNSPYFPTSAHDLVLNPNGRGMLNNSLQSMLSELASLTSTSALSFHLIDLANDLITEDLIEVELQIKFDDTSTVIFKISNTSTDFVSKDPVIHVTQVHGSLRDNQNNTLFESASDFSGNIFGMGSGGAGAINFRGWSSMISRLRNLGHFSQGTCYFSGTNEVTCPYTTSD